MKKITIEIETINAAFEPVPSFEIHRILEEITSDLEKSIQIGVIHDINGNKVGTITID